MKFFCFNSWPFGKINDQYKVDKVLWTMIYSCNCHGVKFEAMASEANTKIYTIITQVGTGELFSLCSEKFIIMSFKIPEILSSKAEQNV